MAFDWDELGIVEITNLLLFGSITLPEKLVDDALIRLAGDAGKPSLIDVNMASYMASGPGRFALRRRGRFLNWRTSLARWPML